MANSDRKILITDTSILINFLNIQRIDLLKNSSFTFYITEHVVEEISRDYPSQQLLLRTAISDKIFTIVEVNEEAELVLYAKLMLEPYRLGSGECSAIACAINRKYALAIDDSRAIKQARQIDQELEIVKTQDIIVQLIKEKRITLGEADSIKQVWEKDFRFALKFKSFLDILS